MACGPITMEKYESILELSLDRIRKINPFGSKLLPLDLQLTATVGEHGQLFISHKTQKLYVAIPIDSRLFES